MKLSALVAALLALSLSACGEKAPAPAVVVEAPAAVSAVEVAPVAAPAAEAASAPAEAAPAAK
ncbi:MAG: hypothetical protein NTY60_09825 [Proteobacteria bacterium]|nr:hypothetical protein [Pseudomonadota bacterium]